MKNVSVELDPKSIEFIISEKYRIFRHLGLWLAFFALIFFSTWLNQYSGIHKFYRFIDVFVVFLSLIYINIYILLPCLFFKGRYILYMIALVIMVQGGIALSSFLITFYPQNAILADHSQKQDGYTNLLEGTIVAVLIILITTTIKLFQRWARDKLSIAELKSLTLAMELNELKNQINPHFLFNMLNGIKALVRIDPEKATVVIMKLSEFLRYQLYENNRDKVLLGAEMKFLSTFLSLETLRRDNLETQIRYTSPEGVLNSLMLPPNLFITFVENAVKHSVTINEGRKSVIDIEIGIEDNFLQFTCINSKDPAYIPSDKNSGLGLANIKRRLALLYGDNYHLDIDSTPNEYRVKLKLLL